MISRAAHLPTQLNSVETQQVDVLQDRLDGVGVDVVVEAPTLKGASVEGDAQVRTIRLDPAIVSQGVRLMVNGFQDREGIGAELVGRHCNNP